MTPATQAELYLHRGYRIIRPRDAVGREGHVVWTAVWDSSAPARPSVDELLPDYSSLASATDDEAAEFVARWGIPELSNMVDQNEKPLDWERVDLEGAGRVPVSRIREHALAVAAARRIGAALAAKRLGDPADWKHVAYLLNPAKRTPGLMPPRMIDELGTSWQAEREHFGAVLSDALRGAGVATAANWLDQDRLTLTPTAQGLVGVVMLLVAREVGSGREFTCSSCQAPVVRRRAPLEGESVYCDRPECKREQRRRNQAAWRRARRAGK